MSVCWYEDDEIGIFFNIIPDVDIRIIMPEMTKDEIEDIKEKPFKNNTELAVTIKDKIEQISYYFLIPKDYTWDGASIPRVFWRLMGTKTDPRFLVPSLIHDVLCENHDYIDNDRYLSSVVFERLLYVSNVNPVSRCLLKHSVDNFQKFCRW